MISEREVIHRCPTKGESLTKCCGKTPFELHPYSRMTLDPELVTCGVLSEDFLKWEEE